MYAQRSAQEAYVESLYAMNQEQLIAEVMRVQIAAAELIKQEVAAEREACAKIVESSVFSANALEAIRARGEESVKH